MGHTSPMRIVVRAFSAAAGVGVAVLVSRNSF